MPLRFRNSYTREWSSNRPIIHLFGFEKRYVFSAAPFIRLLCSCPDRRLRLQSSSRAAAKAIMDRPGLPPSPRPPKCKQG
ncbi:hypothetical protein UPYG_G00081350 [Umbra pygmaea]|uniref:Uncharacterized protein n=1 Tax=Umbra pygmaea TaxID=75934 RepID=A0ABD0XDW0_UMBPY